MLLRREGGVFKKRGRVLKKRGWLLKKICLVRRTGGGLLLQKGGGVARGVADVWEKDVRDFQAKPGSSGSCPLFLQLAAQCEKPPDIAHYPFEVVSQRGVSHPFALFS